MIVLGLGSNVSDRLGHLRKALKALRTVSGLSVIQVSPIYTSDALLPEGAPADWDMPYFNLAIKCKTSLAPLELLKQLKNIEWSIGRKPEIRHWGPRVLDIDILAWDDLVMQTDTLTVPHHHLQDRPFALWPLADVAPFWQFPLPGANHLKTAAVIVEKWGSRFDGQAPFHTRQINQRIDMPQLVGVLNITPDSYSDGMLFLEAEKALAQIKTLVNAGAEIIDIGAESTCPKAESIDAETEWSRLEPVLSNIKTISKDLLLTPKVSIDTRRPDIAEKALSLGVDWINDVSGLDDPHMRSLIKDTQADCVIMHHLSIPERRNNVLPRDQDPVKLVYEWGARRLEGLTKEGIALERIIFDPGIGFGVEAEQSLALLRNVAVFADLNVRILVGHSRKTFMALLTNEAFKNRDTETLAFSLSLAKQPIDYLRLHNVEMCARGFRVLGAMG